MDCFGNLQTKSLWIEMTPFEYFVKKQISAIKYSKQKRNGLKLWFRGEVKIDKRCLKCMCFLSFRKLIQSALPGWLNAKLHSQWIFQLYLDAPNEKLFCCLWLKEQEWERERERWRKRRKEHWLETYTDLPKNAAAASDDDDIFGTVKKSFIFYEQQQIVFK